MISFTIGIKTFLFIYVINIIITFIWFCFAKFSKNGRFKNDNSKYVFLLLGISPFNFVTSFFSLIYTPFSYGVYNIYRKPLFLFASRRTFKELQEFYQDKLNENNRHCTTMSSLMYEYRKTHITNSNDCNDILDINFNNTIDIRENDRNIYENFTELNEYIFITKNRIDKHLENNIKILELSDEISDRIVKFNLILKKYKTEKIYKRVYSEIDPYGEEDWEN